MSGGSIFEWGPTRWPTSPHRVPNNRTQHLFDYVRNIIVRSLSKPLLLFLFLFLSLIELCCIVDSASINYGVSQRPITDINQLMPALCQNQSVICESSFCIPGVKKCVCDLRQPVAFGRFCLRQVDIETKCFATSQCNHTIKDAVCMDASSQTALDYDSSKFKLEHWQQLHELRLMSQSAKSKELPSKQQRDITFASTSTIRFPDRAMFFNQLGNSNADDNMIFEARDDVIVSDLRNSPYEITTPELLLQNHTRRKPTKDPASLNVPTNDIDSSSNPTKDPISEPASDKPPISQSRPNSQDTPTSTSTAPTTAMAYTVPLTEDTTIISSSSSPPASELNSKKKMIIKTPNWPPGVCACPHGFMFDAMLRKCLGLSLADAHCQSDTDCRQIKLTHCSKETKKCVCDEPFVWDRNELSCQRPSKTIKSDHDIEPSSTTISTTYSYPFTPATTRETSSNKDGIHEILPTLLVAKLLPNQTILLLIFVIVVVIVTLIILRLTVKCFSSNNTALISPKSSKNKFNKNSAGNHTGLPPRSPYATLKRPEYHNKHSQFTQATRGRILNYDFEQDSPTASGPHASDRALHSPQPTTPFSSSATMHRGSHSKRSYKTTTTIERQIGGGTLSRLKMHKHGDSVAKTPGFESIVNSQSKFKPDICDYSRPPNSDNQPQELNDNVSVGQLELEGGSENSKSDTNSSAAIQGPPPAANQPPPYMLASSSMKGQGSAIAAAAAAVANRRIQMAQKKAVASSSPNEQQQSSKMVANGGTPVFL